MFVHAVLPPHAGDIDDISFQKLSSSSIEEVLEPRDLLDLDILHFTDDTKYVGYPVLLVELLCASKGLPHISIQAFDVGGFMRFFAFSICPYSW